MANSTIHNPDRYMADLRQTLSQGRKRMGILIGAGAPMAVKVDGENRFGDNGTPIIPDVAGLTTTVIAALNDQDQQTVKILTREIGHAKDPVNIETILTQIRRLAQAIGTATVHGLNGEGYGDLAQRVCDEIGKVVRARLPSGVNPYTELVSWISGTQRVHSVEVFTPNYDLLLEESFERARVPYFDGFSGSHRPFFDAASVSSDDLPTRWSLLWKLHGSLGWAIAGDTVVRTGQREATELICPDHLKYDRVTRLPYSALFERLRQFLMTPDTLLLCTGFSFVDSHICAVMDEALAGNAHTSLCAFQYGTLIDELAASRIAYSRPNVSVYARDGAIISGVQGFWSPGHPPNEDWQAIRRTFWRAGTEGTDAQFLLGDFGMLTRFLALTQAQQIALPGLEHDSTNGERQDPDAETSEEGNA